MHRRHPGIDSPLLWGTEERLRELFGDGITDLRAERRISRQPFRSADHYIEFFRTYFGPTQMAYERVGSEGEEALTDDLRTFLEAANTAGDRAMVLEADYLEVIATRAWLERGLGLAVEHPEDGADQQHREEDHAGDRAALPEGVGDRHRGEGQKEGYDHSHCGAGA